VTILPPHALREGEIRSLLRAAYDIVRAALPRKVQNELSRAPTSARKPKRPARRARH
jgi:predicted DNA-binding protein (MmcQ/YjbR family)